MSEPIFQLIAICKDPLRVWPVMWGLDRDVCDRLRLACIAEQEAMRKELEPIWEKMEDLDYPRQWVGLSGRRRNASYDSELELYNADRVGLSGRRRNASYDSEFELYNADRERLEKLEREINDRYRDTMIDALFPTGNDGWLPEVKYVVWTVHEHLRSDLTAKELRLLRAKLHGGENGSDEVNIYGEAI